MKLRDSGGREQACDGRSTSSTAGRLGGSVRLVGGRAATGDIVLLITDPSPHGVLKPRWGGAAPRPPSEGGKQGLGLEPSTRGFMVTGCEKIAGGDAVAGAGGSQGRFKVTVPSSGEPREDGGQLGSEAQVGDRSKGAS